MDRNTFIDSDDQLFIEVYYEVDGKFIELPSNHWLHYSSAT